LCYKHRLKKVNIYQIMRKIFNTLLLLLFCKVLNAQTCPTATGDQVSYGTGNIWIGYVYNNLNFTDYMGFVNEGTAGSPNFDQNFGGGNVNYPTSTCATNTNTFSVRYRLQLTLTAGAYTFLIGGDDGVRLSIDGGVTYLLNDFSDHGYRETQTTVSLTAGTYNLVYEYYENGGGNRVRFNFAPDCIPVTTDETSYGTGDVWRGITYSNLNFTSFKGIINAGVSGNPNFDLGFGGDAVNFSTSDCPVLSETFSVRFKLNKTFPAGTYNITIGGDDGYRLSIDGGVTFPFGDYTDHAYATTTFNVSLSGSTNLVYEFYENGGQNRVTFAINSFIPLPIELIDFYSKSNIEGNKLIWQTATEKNNSYFEIHESKNGLDFSKIAQIPSKAVNGTSNYTIDYSWIDKKQNNIYYLLRQVDIDGTSKDSKIIYHQGSNQTEKLLVYPNPFRDTFFVKFLSSAESKTIIVSNHLGKQIDKLDIPPNLDSWEYKSELPKGTYLIKIFDGSKVFQEKLIKL
jgi:hypothetical protein